MKVRSKKPTGIILPVKSRLMHAASPVLETMEARMMMSTTIAAWAFSTTAGAPDNSPSPTAGTGTAISLGMTNTYSYAGTTATNSVTNDDITSVAGTAPTVTEDVWRVRGHYVSTGTAPNNGTVTGSGNVNGWNLSAPQGTQGVEFDVSTVGYQTIQASFDWEATSQGVRNLQEQYNINTANSAGWTNINAPLVASAGNYLLANPIDLSGISGANSDANFGIRMVSVYDPVFGSATYSSASSNNTTQTVYNNSSGNWGFNNVKISGSQQINAAPAITTQPAAQSVAAGSTATFTAAASGFPAPTVQWYTGTPGGTNSPISGATSSTYVTPATTAGQTGTTYYAVFTNSQGTATTNAVTLTVTSAVAVTLQPVSQNIQAGAPVTFTASATGSPAPTVQWQSSTDNVNFSNISGATSTTLTFTAVNADANTFYRAVFTNGSTSATTSAALLAVIGEPISQWIFTAGLAPTPNGINGGSVAGSGDQPFATLNGSGSDSSTTLGLQNDYTNVPAYSESDILPEQSSINTSYAPYLWRIRSGSGSGPTGSPGSPPGWSQLAPQETSYNGNDPQGVEFKVNTSGYQDITLHFVWDGGGVADMQAQYSPDGGQTWTNVGSVMQNFSKDYPGITSSTTPPGYTVDLQGISAASNNPNFAIRLVTAYDPELPLITDGNLDEPLTTHGQYADSAAGSQNAVQVLDIGGDPIYGQNGSNVSGGTYELSFNGATTGPIAYNATPSAIATALNGLSTIGGLTNPGSVTVTQTLLTPLSTIGSNALLSITFGGSLGNQIVAPITVTNNTLTGTTPTATVTTWIPGAAAASIDPATGYQLGITRYQDGGGTWKLGNFSFNGIQTSGAPGIVTNPISETVAGGGVATFTASDYSETTPVTVQWQVNTGMGWTNIAGATNYSTGTSTSTYSFTTNVSRSDSGHLFRAVFTNSVASSNTVAATLTVVDPTPPSVITQPLNVSVQAGNVAQFNATSTGAPTPTVQWQVNTGSGWSNLTDGPGVSGSATNTLRITSTTAEIGTLIQYRAAFTNVVSTVNSNAVTMTVLAAESVITDWDFSSHANSGSSAYDNSPAPTIGTGVATGVGMLVPFNSGDPATGTDGNGAVQADDITSEKGTLNPNFVENAWRIRGGATATTGGTPANGWSNLAPQYTQGVQFSTSSVGYSGIYVTMDWYTTTSGILDARQQYTLDGTTWYNLDDKLPESSTDPYAPIQAVSGDFYGATASGGPIPLVFDLTGVSGVANNANFAVRLVSAWDPSLPTVTGLQYTDGTFTNAASVTHGQYANAALVGSPPAPAPYNGSKGNWQFDNIVIHGSPMWLDPSSLATWTASTHSLVVTGAAKIIGDPGTDEPVITANGLAAQLTIDTGSTATVNIGGLNLTGGASIIMPTGTTSHVLIVAGGASNISIDSASKLDLGANFMDIQDATALQAQNSLAILTADLQIGFSNGSWSGLGITSSTAQTNASHLTTIGSLINNGIYGTASGSLGTFDGINPGTYDVLVRYTYYGDANLDGRVDGSDYTAIDSAYVTGGSLGWANGNFNYDGAINGSDYTLIDNAFNTQGARLAAVVASQIASPTGKVEGHAAANSFIPSAYPAGSTQSIADLMKWDQGNTLTDQLLDDASLIS